MEDVRKEANKLKRAVPTLHREVGWQIAWVAVAIKPEMVGDVIQRIQSREVRNPRRYVERAIQIACQENGYVWSELKQFVPKAPEKQVTPSEVVKAAAEMQKA